MWTTTGPATTAMRPPARLDLLHHRRDARHADLDAALGRDFVRHEREPVPVALLELGNHAHTGHAAHDAHRLSGRRGACGTTRVPSSMTITASIR